MDLDNYWRSRVKEYVRILKTNRVNDGSLQKNDEEILSDEEIRNDEEIRQSFKWRRN